MATIAANAIMVCILKMRPLEPESDAKHVLIENSEIDIFMHTILCHFCHFSLAVRPS